MSWFRTATLSEPVADPSPELALEVTPPARNVVREMALTAVPVAPLLGDSESELDKLTELHARLLPVEDEAKEQVERRIEQLRAAKEIPYKRLSLEPISWRDETGRPVFAIYRLDNPACVIGWMPGMGVGLPGALRVALEGNVHYGQFSSAFVSRFSGILPTEVRAEIVKARPVFGEELFILAEANWVAVPRPKGDPLIVGWRANSLWLVTQFDTTDLESYVVSEFPA